MSHSCLAVLIMLSSLVFTDFCTAGETSPLRQCHLETLLRYARRIGIPQEHLSYQPAALAIDPLLTTRISAERLSLLEQIQGYRKRAGNNNDTAMLNNPSLSVGQHFDAHGIAKPTGESHLRQLVRLINVGINLERDFHSAPLTARPGVSAALGGSVRDDGGFMILGGVKQSLRDGIRYVIANDSYYHAIPTLQSAYPEIGFFRADEMRSRLTEVLRRHGISVSEKDAQNPLGRNLRLLSIDLPTAPIANPHREIGVDLPPIPDQITIVP